jgi:hypothetical protein
MNRPKTPTPLLDKAPLHKVLAALEQQLAGIGHTHSPGPYHQGLCDSCGPRLRRPIPVATCRDCRRELCGVHLAWRVFADAAEESRYYRLRSKIRRVSVDLAQGRLFTGP